MKNGTRFCLAAMLLLYSFTENASAQTMNSNTNARFDSYKERFVLDLWKQYPGWASSVGYHLYDSVLVIPDDRERAQELEFVKNQLDSLSQFDIKELTDANKTDYYLIDGQLKYTRWGINDQKAYEWDPSGYNVAGSFADMLANDYEPLDVRLHKFYVRMEKVPAYYEAAKRNIRNPTVEHTQLSIEQNLGGVSVFEDDLKQALDKSHLTETERAQLLKRAGTAIAAMKDFASWLGKLKNDHPRSFRLGKQLYDKKFEYEIQSSYSAEEIYQKAIGHKEELHREMFDITRKLWPKYFEHQPMPADKLVAIRRMIDTISVYHTTPDSFQAAIEQQLPMLTAFISKKDLLYMDPSKPLVVRKEPAYMAGVAGASISAPGPYDKAGNTYYNVGSLASYSKEAAESFLREYNHYILQILNIHEAIPGHYTQLVYANQSPSIIKSILGNGAMIEGWAVYTERMMLENGYDGDKGPESTEASPEMWLMYYKWNLRSTCNTILDNSVHTRNMDKTAAMHLLMDEAFQQKAEAEGKWKRVSVTQVQLCCYFTGYTEIYDLREDLKKKQGDAFSLKQFHEKFLSYGSAPVKYIRQLMEH